MAGRGHFDYNAEYSQFFSTTNIDGSVSDGQSLLHRRPNEGTNHSDGALLNNNQEIDDLVDPPTGRDALFLAGFTTLPQPSSFALAACGAMACLVCLWWRKHVGV